MIQSKNKIIEIKEAEMLEAIRDILKLSIEDFVYQMDWPNTKYYDFIKNGRKRGGEEKKLAHPTIQKVFTGINSAIAQYDNWKAKSTEITAIIITYLMPSA